MKLPVMCAAALFAATSAAEAVTFSEVGDASHFFGSQQVVGAGVTALSGTIGSGDEGDLFAITIDAVSSLVLTVARTGSLDPMLMLFNSAGQGLFADDDSGGGLNSQITTGALAAGTYLVGILDFTGGALDTDGDLWSANFAVNAPAPGSFGTLERLDNTGSIATGSYTISMNTQTAAIVPLPASALLLLGGLGMFGFVRRRTS